MRPPRICSEQPRPVARRLALVAVSLLLGLAGGSASAQVYVDASDGRARVVAISQTDPSRISVLNGRIVQLVYDEVELSVTSDPSSGQVFVKPMVDKPVSVFVLTERASHPLILQPQQIPLQTVMIREGGGADGSDQRPVSREAIETAGALDVAVKRLVTLLARGERSHEFRIVEFNQSVALWKEASFVLVARYEGRSLVGEHYRLRNISPSVMRLAEQELYKKGVLAVSIELHQLDPAQSTDIFVVRLTDG